MRARAQRPRLPETSDARRAARQSWNGGMVGSARNGELVPLVHACTVPGCGSCAAIDRALADLRTGGHGGGAR